MIRKPLAVGNKYIFPKFPINGFEIIFFIFSDTPSSDGGIPGVSLKWFGNTKVSYFYPFNSEESFWNNLLFKDSVSI